MSDERMNEIRHAVTHTDAKQLENALQLALEYACEALREHDAKLGRKTYKNRVWAEQIERDILEMRHAHRTVFEMVR